MPEPLLKNPVLTLLGFQMIPPSPPLAPFVQCYWVVEKMDSIDSHITERLIPDGGTGISFNFGDGILENGRSNHKKEFIQTVSTHAVDLSLTGNINCMGIRFKPGGAFPFFRIPLNKWEHEVGDLDLLSAFRKQSLFNQLAESKHKSQKIAILDNFLLSLLNRGFDDDPVVVHALMGIESKYGNLSIPELVRDMSISQRQLERKFKMQVGISPKKYARLIRVLTAQAQLKHAAMKRLTDISYDVGYFDQAHFIREFKDFIGVTPSTYSREFLLRRKNTIHL